MIDKVNHSLKIIGDAIEKYPAIAIASSFGKDSIVVIHLARQIYPEIQIFSVMTPYKFKETREYKDEMTDFWDLNVKTYEAPELGMLVYKQDVSQCCKYYKVEQVKRAIEDLKLDAWISGMRSTEGETRREVPEIQEDNGLIKVNPILEWTETDVWMYHSYFNIIPNPLYYEGYRSLGCEPCSSKGGEFERDGRWKGTCNQGGECQIHTIGMKSGKTLELK